jgi:hypothetical protein
MELLLFYGPTYGHVVVVSLCLSRAYPWKVKAPQLHLIVYRFDQGGHYTKHLM